MKKLVLIALTIGAPACANDPEYIGAPNQLEATGMETNADGDLVGVKASLNLPYQTEKSEDMTSRMALAAQLMVDVPYVKVDDLRLSIEWTIKNLDTEAGTAKIQLNGANEFFVYDPEMIVLAPDDDEAPPTPGLEGDVPIDIPAGGEISGLFREDQLLEAAIDMDQVTRGHLSPFAATLQIDKNVKSFQPLTPPMPMDEDYVQMPTGPAIPREAMANFVRIDLVFKPDHHMVLEYAVRVRDTRGIMDDKLLDAPMSELAVFEPMIYAP